MQIVYNDDTPRPQDTLRLNKKHELSSELRAVKDPLFNGSMIKFYVVLAFQIGPSSK